MSKEIYISSTPHETRLAIVENDALTEIYYERENEYSLAGSIYNGKVTRVLPGMQSSFVDIGLDRDAFLYITDFMEEAGDSAEFDSHGGGRAPRESGGRSEGRRSGGREERGGREEQPRLASGSSHDGMDSQSEVREPSDAELFTEAVSGLDPARPVANGDRGGSRRGGRGRSDRNSDGTPRRDRGPDRGQGRGPDRSQDRVSGNRADSPRSDSPRMDTPRAEPVRPVSEQPILGTPRPAENSGEVGEGAPGADGSRRWRGRRGRRGSRPDVPRDGGAASSLSPDDVAIPAAQSAPSYESYEDSPVESYPAEVAAEPLDARPPVSASTTNGRRGREDRSRPSREDHGGRDDRGNRGERSVQAPRVPRGFAPSTSLYQVDGSAAEPTVYGEEESPAAPAEPMILPGESLSKYRAGGNEPASPASAATAPAAPATEFVASGWDGGMVLPGETIRPRGPRPETRSETTSQARPEEHGGGVRRESSSRDASNERTSRGGDRGGRDSRGEGRGRDERGGRGERPDRGSRGESQPEALTEATMPLRPDQRFQRSGAAATPVTPVHFDPLPAQPAMASSEKHPQVHTTEHAEASEPTHLTPPEEISSRHLATPSEQPGQPVNSTFVPPPPMPTAEPTPVAETVVAVPHLAEQEYEPSEASASYRIDPIAPSEFRQAAPVAVLEPVEQLAGEREPDAETHAHAHSEPEAPANQHEVTSIFATGEMHSEPAVQELTTHELTTQDLTAPAPSAQGAQESTEPQSAEIAAADQSLPYFAPGTGLLEEETLEDEEYSESAPLPTLHGHAEPEQETLEGAADLGSMIQEMAIDRSTRGEPLLDDEDEDDDLLEEDQDYEESEFEEGEEDEEDAEETEGEPRGFEDGGDFRESHGAEGEETARELEQAAFGGDFDVQPQERNGADVPSGSGTSSEGNVAREPRRDGRSGDRGRRDGRRGDRGGRSASGDRGSGDRGSRSSFSSSGSSGDRDRDRGRDGARSAGGDGNR